MNSLSFPTGTLVEFHVSPRTRLRARAAFRFPREMYVPAKAIAITFNVEPAWNWIVRSFLPRLRPVEIAEPAWMR